MIISLKLNFQNNDHHFQNNLSKLGTGGNTKTDEFSENSKQPLTTPSF